MRKSTKIAFAAAAACLIAAGGTAFTAANTGVDAAFVGYQTAVISGVVVTNTAYNVEPLDASKLKEVVFTTTSDVDSGYTAVLTINGPTGTRYDCVEAVALTITCATTDQLVDPIVSVGLTVSAD